MFTRGKGGGINWEIEIVTHYYIYRIGQKVPENPQMTFLANPIKYLLSGTGNSTQYYMGKNLKRVDMCICITDSLFLYSRN